MKDTVRQSSEPWPDAASAATLTAGPQPLR